MANRYTPGNAFWRGDWEYCPEYNIGDVVIRGGLFFLAVEHSAGEDPLDPLSAGYWLPWDGNGPGPMAELLWTGTTINVTFARVATRTELPVTLIPGRLYYIADEGVVLLDMGSGAEEYGGNHGMQYYRGAFATEADLIYAFPADIEGAYAVVFATNTFWIWKDGRWLDTGTTATDFGLPPGGDLGDALVKRSNADGDAGWSKILPGHVIQNASGAALPQRKILQIKGATLTDDPTGEKTVMEVTSGGGTGDHDELTHVRGDMASAVDARHVTPEQLNDIRDIRSGRPLAPKIVAPVGGAIEVPPIPLIETSTYTNFAEIPMQALRVQIARDIAFSDIVFDATQSGVNTAMQVPAKEDGTYYLEPDTQYYVRAWHQAANNVWSGAGAVSTFFTDAVFLPAYPYAPSILIPTEGQVVWPENITIMADALAAVGESLSHESTDWEVRETRDPATPTIWDSRNNTADKMSVTIPGNIKDATTASQLYATCLYHAKTLADVPINTPRSVARMFRLAPVYDKTLIGLERVLSSGLLISRYIDENGEYITLPGDYFDKHPLYAALTQNQILDGQTMGFLPTVHIRTQAEGTTVREWLNINAFPGSNPHPAFRYPTSQGGQYLGKVFGSSTTEGRSVPGETLSYRAHADIATVIQARNRPGSSGWHLSDVYLETLMRMLIRFEICGVNPTVKYGTPTAWVNGAPPLNNNTTYFKDWRGFYGLWSQGGYQNANEQKMLGISFNITTKMLELGSPADPYTLINTGREITYGRISDYNTNACPATALLSGHDAILNIDYDNLYIPSVTVNSGNNPFFVASQPLGVASPACVGGVGNSLGLGGTYAGNQQNKYRIAKWLS